MNNKGIPHIYYAQLLVVASLPFHFLVSSYAIGLLILIFIGHVVWDSNFRVQVSIGIKRNKIAWFFIFLFALYLISFLVHFSEYTEFSIGSSAIEKKLSYLLFPILFSSVTFLDREKVLMLFKVFVLAVLLSSVIALILGAYHTIASGSLYYYDASIGVTFNNFMYHRLGSYVGLHAVYLAEYVLFALVLVAIYAKQKFHMWDSKNRLFFIGLGFYFILIIFLLKSAAIMIILLVSIALFLFYFFYKARDLFSLRTKIIVPIIGIMVIAVLGYRVVDKIGSKADYFSYDLSEPGGGEWNAINLRLAKWNTAVQVISEHWLLGVGPGNTERVLDEKYASLGFNYALQLHYNPHNQFLHTFIAIGLAGFVMLLLLLIMLFSSSFQKNDIVFLIFLVSLTLFSISESTLAVNKGIVFFTLFSSIFSYLPEKLSTYIND